MSKLQYYVYIVSNYDRKVIYVGVTNNLVKRVYEHRNGLVDGFTKKYKTPYLIYYEVFTKINSAIDREKQIKSWGRVRKNKLIREFNPQVIDLYSSILN
jgi:putative endonuclease